MPLHQRCSVELVSCRAKQAEVASTGGLRRGLLSVIERPRSRNLRGRPTTWKVVLPAWTIPGARTDPLEPVLFHGLLRRLLPQPLARDQRGSLAKIRLVKAKAALRQERLQSVQGEPCRCELFYFLLACSPMSTSRRMASGRPGKSSFWRRQSRTYCINFRLMPAGAQSRQ
jgi:hypothetical protein